MRKASGIIPARYNSQRFPGKPLAPILGKPMIQRVYERAIKAEFLENVIIATDDQRIFDAALSFGADVRMTSSGHRSGTSRAAEIASSLDSPLIINIQGDEPLLHVSMIDDLIQVLQDKTIDMATLAVKDDNIAKIKDKNIVKIVKDHEDFALYFSRSPIPFNSADYFWKHIGIYGYQRTFLLKFESLPETRLEKVEKLEQLRALENGFRIKVVSTPHSILSVDTPEDIIKVENILREGPHD
ncbi:MAG: 3-deoxy-manno-octulosonate cytidylyltransferase [Candidatus Aminicenantes bacterium]|nr:3-deoxy-manno-octulosonate cytidylyltransferase [Candidatus Aminicenantes bacterium]